MSEWYIRVYGVSVHLANGSGPAMRKRKVQLRRLPSLRVRAVRAMRRQFNALLHKRAAHYEGATCDRRDIQFKAGAGRQRGQYHCAVHEMRFWDVCIRAMHDDVRHGVQKLHQPAMAHRADIAKLHAIVGHCDCVVQSKGDGHRRRRVQPVSAWQHLQRQRMRIDSTAVPARHGERAGI